ncbi:MAG TPA: GH92 family glycosyl hydrolase, partial [Prolixibacteraceae bacterium]|nr:GH92 family glycosyl hydrolase [Prolixibacteraceae bacterium]
MNSHLSAFLHTIMQKFTLHFKEIKTSSFLSHSIRLSVISVISFLLLSCATRSNLDSVDTTIGNVGILLQPTRPNVHLPNQMVRFYPVRADYLDDQISFFPLTISSHRKGELFGVMPYPGEPVAETWEKKQTYDHELETNRPFYYSTFFVDSNIKTEFTPGAKCGFFRFSFPGKGEKFLALRIVNQGNWEMESGNSFSGTEEFSGMKAFVYGEVDQPGQAGKLDFKFTDIKKNETYTKSGAWIRFGAESPQEVKLKYAISFISKEQAKANLTAEITGWDFDAMKAGAELKWSGVMDRIQVRGGTDAQRRTFYTSLYRQYERMININEHGNFYSAYDSGVHPATRDFFVDDWMWDTYLAMHPLRSILHPELEGDMLQSYVTMYEHGGWLPQFPLLFKDDPAMNGFHSTIAMLDAYRKGVRNFDLPKAWEGMLKNATKATMLPWRNGPQCILDSFYREKGFYPALWPGQTET